VIASIWLPILAGALLFVALLMAAVVVGGYLLWRRGRRKWRMVRNHGVIVGASTLWAATSSGRFRPPVAASADDVRRWAPRQVRRVMWRAVDQADTAVQTATGVGAPIASLPSLCQRLRHAAMAVDQVLQVEPTGVVPPEVASQAFEVMRAAGDVQRAAVASASDANATLVRDLSHDADQEIQCLDAGLASARVAMPRHRG
jgi:hypothetical protein